MPKKCNHRSVAIQSTDFYSPDFENANQPARLKKKAGFRNLLQKSVTIVSQENDEEIENFSSSGVRRSKGVQATPEKELTVQKRRLGGQSLEFFLPKNHSFRWDESRTTVSEMMRVIDRGTEGSNPGTSSLSGAISSTSVSSQINDIYFKRHEGSLAVVYSFEEKATGNSMTSNLALFYGSQGSRRLSDETVLLIEDYQSYDQANAVRRQESESNHRRAFTCCTRSIRRPTEFLTKPLPINFEKFEEAEEIVCRICHEGENIEPLIQPCLCKGSVGSVHATCLKIWLEQSSTSRCELCYYPYAIRQTKKYSKCVSIRVFYKTVVNRRALAYDIISFVVITPLTLVGVVMCIQASVFSTPGDSSNESSFQMGYITKVGMIMLSGTILIAYAVWLYTLISYHYKSWKKWYSNCFDVEVIPVRMTSEERLEAARRLNEELNRRNLSREHGSALVTVIQSPHSYNFYQRRMSVPAMLPVPQNNP